MVTSKVEHESHDSDEVVIVDSSGMVVEVSGALAQRSFGKFALGLKLNCINFTANHGNLKIGQHLWEFIGQREDGVRYVVRLRVAKEEYSPIGPRYLLVVEEIGSVERSIAELFSSGDRFKHALETSPIAVFILGVDRRLIFANSAFYSLIGVEPSVDDSFSFIDFVVERDQFIKMLSDIELQEIPEVELTLMSPQKVPISCLCRVCVLENEATDEKEYAISVIDTSPHLSRTSQMEIELHQDPLTALLNRIGAESSYIALRDRLRQDEAIALFFLDLDRFKIINDTKGHLVGDRILIEVSQRLTSTIRQGDYVARLGGDEFIVIANGFFSEEAARNYGNRLARVFSRPFNIDGDEFVTTASVGLALCDSTTLWIDALRNADIAMYEAKANSSSKLAVFDETFRARIAQRARFEGDLRLGIASGEIYMVYQPIVSLATGKVAGFETLARWRRSDGRVIAPLDFISVAEDIGVISEIGELALMESAILLRTHSDLMNGLVLTINVSPVQLEGNYYKRFITLLESISDISSSIVVEVKESFSLNRSISSATFRDDMRSLGVRIAVDDFGTGYSSLAQVVELAPDIVKIDRKFIGALEDPSHRLVVAAIMAMCDALGATVVAEGVESSSQLRLLDALGCHMVQGFLLSPAVEVDKLFSVSDLIETRLRTNEL